MLEKLLSLLLHAKGGAVATVLVLGASGALVTATVENGTTTVTVTQASQSPAASPTGTASPAILALFNRTNAEDDPTSPATGNGCSDAAHATNVEVQRVNDTYKTDHAAVLAEGKAAPKTSEARALVKAADAKVKDWRQVGVKKIHELFKSDECKGNADEDNDEDVDTDNDDEDDATGDTGDTSTTTTVAITCTDAKACADAAIAEMDKVVEELKTALEDLEETPATTNTNATPGNKPDKADRDSHDNKGKGKGRG